MPGGSPTRTGSTRRDRRADRSGRIDDTHPVHAVSLLPFLIVTTVGAVVGLLLRRNDRLATGIAVIALLAALVTALTIQPGQSVAIGGAGLATTDYLRLFLVLGSAVGLLLVVIGHAVGSRRDAPAVTLGILATSALALSLPDPRLAVLAATAGGGFGALVTLVPVGGRAAATVGTRVLRATVVAGTMAIAATAWIGRDLSDLVAQPVVFGLAYLAFALAVAIRFGAIPFHGWAARLTDTVPESTLPLVTAWAPAAFAIVALAWADASIAPLGADVDLDPVRAVVLAIAVTSIVLASVAAFIQDDIEHVVGYAIIGDAGVVLLAVAALDPAAWAPARTWILAFVVSRSAFAAWAAATRMTFLTGRVDDLRGWAIRSPVLAVVFALVVIASIGIPGLAAFDARWAIIQQAIDGPLAALILLGTLSPLAYYGRLLVVGAARPDVPRGRRPLAPGRLAGRSDRPPDLARADVVGQPGADRDRRGGPAGDPGARGVGRGVRRATGGGGAAADARGQHRIVRADRTRDATRVAAPPVDLDAPSAPTCDRAANRAEPSSEPTP